MSPPPQPSASEGPLGDLTGEEIVVTGISGIFPSSNSTLEFMENLFNQVDMVTEENLNFDHPEAPKHIGKITGTRKFDAQFFRVTYNQAMTLEPMSKKLLEHAYTAMYDSGINPLAYKGRKVGVFVGSSYSDTANVSMYDVMKSNGSMLSGSSKTMYANRISFWIDGRGPSYNLDCSCSSSMVCLEHAYTAMKNGQCDAALVAGCNSCVHPILSFNLKRGGFLCMDGKTKCFDQNGDGYVRAEAISVLFLQKAKEAKRIYMEVCHADVKYGLKPDAEFLPFRKLEDIKSFLEDFYADANISPKDIGYVEAHGAATTEADADELEAIGEVFGKHKTTPVYVGSVKSNMGNSEPASGACALTKLCLAYHKGELPANLHCSKPIDVSSIRDGLVRVLRENIPFDRGYTAVNNFSITGINCHALLRGHFKKKDSNKYKSTIPRLIVVSGRQEECVNKIFDILNNDALDPEVIGMLHNIYKIETPGHTCRGYTVVDTNEENETINLARGVEYYSGTSKPLWLLFSGVGSQWPGMGAALMQIPVFASAIEKCHRALEPKGIDILKIITENDKAMFDKILNVFVGISAVQIGLIGILKEIGVKPDFIIGHSLGEMACAYWDGSLTAEEMILGAYCRGVVSTETKFIPGAMAAIGLGSKDILPLCPSEIDLACHNSFESTTISGPADVTKQFVADLTSRGIFAKEVQSSNIAFHSRYIRNAGPEFSRQLAKIIKDPKPRSSNWICTSIPQDQWNEPQAQLSSPEFFTNNLLSPVLFEEASKLIPSNAVVVEIAPHGLLQAILKRSHPECTHIPLTRRGHSDPVTFLLEAIGKLYQEGYSVQLESLYPKIEFPVSTETALLSHYVEWEHSENWPSAVHSKVEKIVTTSREIIISTQDDDYEFLRGHVRDGRNIFPEAAILFLAWETLSMYKGCNYQKFSVMFSDIQFYSEIIMKQEDPLILRLMISKGNNRFEVTHENVVIASGYVSEIMKPRFETQVESKQKKLEKDINGLSSDTIYKLLNLRGYDYNGPFQSILSTSTKKDSAEVKWDENWITFIDSLIQLNILTRAHDGLSIPKLIKHLIINTKEHDESKRHHDFGNVFKASLSIQHEVTRCGAIEIRHIYFEDTPLKNTISDLNTLKFVPYFSTAEISLDSALRIILQIIAENVIEKLIKIVEINTDSSQTIYSLFNNGLRENIPNVCFEMKSVTTDTIDINVLEKPHVIVMKSFLKVSNQILNALQKDTFIITFEKDDIDNYNNKNFVIVASMFIQKQRLYLLRKIGTRQEKDINYIFVDHDEKFNWLSTLKHMLQKSKHVVLISERDPQSGLQGLLKNLQKRYNNRIRLITIDDYHASSFDHRKIVYKEQILKNLTFNVFKMGYWGGYYYLPLPQLNSVQHLHLTNSLPGDINGLMWSETVIPAKNINFVEVHYTGPSVRDSQKAAGKFQHDAKLFGMDFSGVNCKYVNYQVETVHMKNLHRSLLASPEVEGVDRERSVVENLAVDSDKDQRVMGMVPEKALASIVQPDQDLLWPIPHHWSMEDAATVPLPYVHAYYCLAIRGKLLTGQSVFINGGAGALGQAVISVALSQACTIYTTVSDMQKKLFLLKLFPELNEKNISFSGHENFNAMVISNSKNRRCDWVISSFNGHLRSAAMKCVGCSGVFQDVNPSDMENNADFGMSFGEKEKNYQSVLLSNIFKPENKKEKKRLQEMIAEGIAKGIVRPISRVVYPPTSVSRAFRLLSQRKNRGRVLLQMRDSENSINRLKAIPRMTYTSDGVFIIKCDSTELGIELADYIIGHGARKVVLHIVQKSLLEYVQAKLPNWRKRGVLLSIFKDKIKTENHCVQLLTHASEMGRLEGIFLVQEHENEHKEPFDQDVFIKTYENSTSIVSMFDHLSRNNCPHLRHFVVISKSNLSAANAYASAAGEKICQARAESGLPALVFHINSNNHNNIMSETPKFVCNSLEISMRQNHTIVQMDNIDKHHDSTMEAKLAQVLGVINIDEIDDSLTLNDIIIDEIALEEIKIFTGKTYGVNYTTMAMKKLTLASLKKFTILEEKSKCESTGLGTFYSFIDPDEYMATDIMIPMKTHLCKRNERDDDVAEEDTYLFLIPGFEGHHRIFVPISQSLKIRAMTFQLGPDIRSSSIQGIASKLKQFIQRRFKLTSKFYLLGYSFGVNVALELASLFENDGLTGVIFCLDSSPDVVRSNLIAHLGKLTDSELQTKIIEHIFAIMSKQGRSKLDASLNDMTWEEKVETCVKTLKNYTTYTSQYTKDVLNTAHNRITLSKTYEPDFKLNSEIVLMKGIKQNQAAENLPNDYNLSKYSTKSIKIFDLASDHQSAPYDIRVTNIVNKSLDADLLEKCKNTNLCEVYLTEAFVMK